MFLFLLFIVQTIGIECQIIEQIPFSIKSSSDGESCIIIKSFPLLIISKNSTIIYKNQSHPILQMNSNELNETFIWKHFKNSTLYIQKPTDNSFQTPQLFNRTQSSKPLTQFNGLYGTFYKIKQNGLFRIIAVSFIPSISKRRPATIITFENYFEIDEIQIGEIVLTIDKKTTVFVGCNESESIIGIYLKNETIIGGDSCQTATELKFPNSIVDFKKNFGDNGVWYKFNGIEGRTITVDTCASESQFDTSVKIFDSCKEELIGYNDNDCGEQSKVKFISKNTDYFIFISHGINATDLDGTFRLNIYDDQPPINLNCLNATNLEEFQVVRTNEIPINNNNYKSVYFKYSTMRSGSLLINSCDKITNVMNDFIIYSSCKSNNIILNKTNNENVCGEFGKYLDFHLNSFEEIIIEMNSTGNGYVHIEVSFQLDESNFYIEQYVKILLTLGIIFTISLIIYYYQFANRIYYDI